MAYLIVMEGENKGMGFELPDAGIITIGRAPANAMVLDVEGVLDYHGVLNIANGTYTYMDKGSTNGSSVNGKPVRSAKLYRGDVLRLGDFPMTLDGEDVPVRGEDIVPLQVVPRPAPVPPKQASASSPETQPSSSAPQCPKCGAKISEGKTKFCPECGEPIALKPEKGVTPCPAPRSFVLAHGGNAPATGTPPYPNLSDKWAWTLACVPIFWMILNIIEWGWVLLFGLGITAILLDAKELRKNGHNPNNWMWTGFILIPVYLFVRANKTNKKYGYAITWCVLFVLSIVLIVLGTYAGGNNVLSGLGESKVFNGTHIHYTSTVTETEITMLGLYLMDSGFTNGDKKDIQVNKKGKTYEFKMVVKKGIEQDPEYLDAFKQFAEELSYTIFDGAQVDVHLCDGYMNTLRVIPARY